MMLVVIMPFVQIFALVDLVARWSRSRGLRCLEKE